ncbi:MAG TPA: hypothetical protein VF045_06710 [Acidimicrobiales bacterium]
MRRESVLLDGLPGREGFVFFDGHNSPVLKAAPGLLGLLEGRLAVRRWRPQIVRWLDDSEHFFDHLCAEFDDERAWQPIRREVLKLKALDAPPSVRSQVLFHFIEATARELERAAIARGKGWTTVPVEWDRTPTTISLDGPWTAFYRQSPASYVERELDLPLNWELVPGIENYAGTMRFTKVLTTGGAGDGSRVLVRFAGVDYLTDVWVNGHHVGGHEGFFGPFEYDASDFVHDGEPIVVRLAVTSPNDPAGPGTHVASGWDDFSPASAFPNRKTLIKGTLGHHDARRGGAWSSMTSQDGNTGGPWGPIDLRVVPSVHFTVPDLRVTTLAVDDDKATVQLRLCVANPGDQAVKATLRVRVESANFEGPAHDLERTVMIASGSGDVVVDADLAPVRLWQPADHGHPHLYRVRAQLVVRGKVQDETEVETGFRVLGVSPIGESTGPNGAWVVNGRAVFVRGTNLLPTYWLSEYTEERIVRDFDMLEAAGFNAVIVHTLVLPKRFYAEANRRGFLVEQIFPLQWTYEQSYERADRALAQVESLTELLVNDPSVVSYEAHNEPDMRTWEDLDNRFLDFDLHAALRSADPSRWVTTFSSGNHAYPGQFYPLRDDNSFATLPARYLEEEVHGRRISRHANMPTEFGIQAMPNVGLFRELVSEERVRTVLERMRNDPKWLAAGGESWEVTSKLLDEVKIVLGRGGWDEALRALDWTLMWEPGSLEPRVREIEHRHPNPADATLHELLSCRLALVLLEVLHYGAFKGENFWFGLWRPARTLEEFVAASQDRQYRLHKDAIEHYLNAGATGPITGFFSFMFRDADWQAPTWGVVDASWTPKKAFRAYQESNAAVRISLPDVLRSPIRMPGDPWAGGSSAVLANDTMQSHSQVQVSVWAEDRHGSEVSRPATEPMAAVELGASTGTTANLALDEWAIPADLHCGVYYLVAELTSASGQRLAANRYELLVPDVTFPALDRLTTTQVRGLLEGTRRRQGFHYWQHGGLAHKAGPGVAGLVKGFRDAQAAGVDLYEVVQGEHLFRHVLAEWAGVKHAGWLTEEVWRIRSEIVSPAEKARVLIRYLELLVAAARRRLESDGPTRRSRTRARPAAATAPATEASPWTPVGRDVTEGPHDGPRKERR